MFPCSCGNGVSSCVCSAYPKSQIVLSLSQQPSNASASLVSGMVEFHVYLPVMCWNFASFQIAQVLDMRSQSLWIDNVCLPCCVWKTMLSWCYGSLLIVIFYILCPIFREVRGVVLKSHLCCPLHSHLFSVCWQFGNLGGSWHLLQREAFLMRTGTCPDPLSDA